MIPNASAPVWSASRGYWIALHRESGGKLWLLGRGGPGAGPLAVLPGESAISPWRYLRDAEEYDLPLFRDALIEEPKP